MAYISAGDISITLSGGTTNSLSENSLGGEPSNNPIIAERLFPDITSSQATDGLEDYRCIYINNNSFDATLYEAILFTEYKEESDVKISLGFIEINERQTISINNANKVTGGSFSVVYSDYEDQTEIVINWSTSYSTVASNLQSALRSIPRLKDVTVIELASGNNVSFEINFEGYAGKRYHEIIQENSNNLTVESPEPGDGEISIGRSVFGSPVNSQAEEIDLATTNPYGVNFEEYSSRENSYFIGEIRPGDVIPVWVRRTVPPDAMGLENDGINIRVEGRALPTPTPTPTSGG